MIKILGYKIGMGTSIINGEAIAVSIIKIPSVFLCKCVNDNKVLLGYSPINKLKNYRPSYIGVFNKFKVPVCKFIFKSTLITSEFQIINNCIDSRKQLNFKLLISLLKVNYINISGRTKGHGFTGVMKRWNFSGGCASHGVSLTHRSIGSIGHRGMPGRVVKGKKMPGRYGNENVYVKNIFIIDLVKDDLLIVKGSVPGKNNAILKLMLDYNNK